MKTLDFDDQRNAGYIVDHAELLLHGAKGVVSECTFHTRCGC